MEKDFSIGELNFKLSKLNALKQFHIARRIAPILKEMIPVAIKLSKGKPEDMADNVEALAPILDGLSKLSDVESEMVLMGLLSAVEIQQMPARNWARVAVDGRLMFSDLDLPVMLQAAGRSFMYNMAGFFAALPQVSHGKQ